MPTSARWALAAALRKALGADAGDPESALAAARAATAALRRATPATLDVLLAHQLPRALAARLGAATGDEAEVAARAFALSRPASSPSLSRKKRDPAPP